jgi:hypothetical protein
VNGTGHRRSEAPVTGGAYAVLFLLGLVQGLIGSFQFARSIGPVPAAALAACLVLFATCLLAGMGMRSAGGAFAVAAGWFVVSVAMSLPTGGGSVILTNTAPALWFVYGGAVVAMAAIVLAYLLWSRPGAARR